MSRHLLFLGAARCWPSAGLLVGGQLACRQVTPGRPGCGLPLRGHRGPGACSRLSPPVPGPHGGRGHTCRTPPWACSVSSQSGATRKRVRSCRTRGVHLGVGSRHPHPYVVDGVRMDTLGHADAPAACIVLEGSGRAGPSVVVNASRREKKEMCIPQLALHLKKRTSISTLALHRDVHPSACS